MDKTAMDSGKDVVIDYLSKCLAVVCWNAEACPFGECPLNHGDCKAVKHTDWVEAGCLVAMLYCDSPEVFRNILNTLASATKPRGGTDEEKDTPAG